jgi:hypothetical protein
MLLGGSMFYFASDATINYAAFRSIYKVYERMKELKERKKGGKGLRYGKIIPIEFQRIFYNRQRAVSR